MNPLAGKRILVIEDEALIVMMLTDMLEELGLSVAATAGGLDQALDLARDAECDLALLDINLNGRMSYPVGEVLRRRGIPFAFATGYASSRKDPVYAAVPRLGKPYNAEQLARTLAGLLAAS